MKFKKLISALSLGTALSAIGLGVVSCSSVEERPTTISGFDETQDYNLKAKVPLESEGCTLAVGSTFAIPIKKVPGDVKYTFSTSNGAVAKVATEEGYVVAVSEGEAIIYIKGTDDTYGEFKVSVKRDIDNTEQVSGNIDGSGTSNVTPDQITADCADYVVIGRNEELKIEFGFDVSITEIQEKARFMLYYSLELDKDYLTSDSEKPEWENITGGTEALRMYGLMNRFVTINDGDRLLPAGHYILTARAQQLTKIIKITVSDDIIIGGVDFVTNQGSSNMIEINGFQTITVTPFFAPSAAQGVTYRLSSTDTKVATVEHTNNGGSATISGVGVGSTFLQIDVGDEKSPNHFRRYIPVVVKEVLVDTFGGFRFTRLADKSAYSNVNDKSSFSAQQVIKSGDKTKMQAMIVPSYATTVYSNSGICYTVIAPTFDGTIKDDYFDEDCSGNQKRRVQENSLKEDAPTIDTNKKTVIYNNGIVECDVKVTRKRIQDVLDESAKKSQFGEESEGTTTEYRKRYAAGDSSNKDLMTGFRFLIASGDRDGRDASKELTDTDVTNYLNGISKRENMFQGFAMTTFGVSSENIDDIQNKEAVENQYTFKIGGPLDPFTNNNTTLEGEVKDQVTNVNMYYKRAVMPVVYLEVKKEDLPSEETTDESLDTIIFSSIFFANYIPVNSAHKQSEYTNLCDFYFDTVTNSYKNSNTTYYVLKKYIKLVSTRKVANNKSFTPELSGSWEYLNFSTRKIISDVKSVEDLQYHTWYAFRIVE